MTFGQIWPYCVPVLVLSIALYFADRRMKTHVKEEKKEWERFKSETVPCDKCLGTGRAPKEGNEWSAEHIARFAKQADLEKIPK